MSREHRDAFKAAAEDMREGMTDDIASRLLNNYGNAAFVYRRPGRLHDLAMASKGPLIEMGSGLSTVVLGIVAEKLNTTLTTIETDQDWANRTQRALDLCQIGTVTIKVGGLPEHIGSLPPGIGFYLLDGPQDMRERALSFPRLDGRIQDAIVLVDDGAGIIETEFTLWRQRFNRQDEGGGLSMPTK
jgi:hypothetical protein